jgi:hypothetical protein
VSEYIHIMIGNSGRREYEKICTCARGALCRTRGASVIILAQGRAFVWQVRIARYVHVRGGAFV